jgi:[ribosomal protein S5]-alanine N-acetyltransferase
MLKAGDLTIRLVEAVDEAGVALAGRDPDIRRMPWFGEGFEDSWAKAWIERAQAELAAGRHHVFSILGDDGRYLGAVVISGPKNDAIEVSYWVLPDARDQGVASRAVTAVLPWARSQFPAARIWAKTAPDNLRSQRVLAKCGFRETQRWENAVVFGWPGSALGGTTQADSSRLLP